MPDGTLLDAAILKPPGFDLGRAYPAVMHMYGGPGSQVVTDSYGGGNGFDQYLAQHGFVCLQVDGRGGGGRGREFRKCTYLKLGIQESDDQIAAARWLATQPFIDGGRIGIWGWSYGGYLAAMCMLRGDGIFRASAAVAPVTDWALYDSIYTERYMRTPVENPRGYAATSALNLAEDASGAFLLLHGAADDNVHFQNSARLAQLLQSHNRPFEMMVYPGKRHGIEGASKHVYGLISDFFVRHCGGETRPTSVTTGRAGINCGTP